MIGAVLLGMSVTLAVASIAATRGTVAGRFVAVQLVAVIAVQLVVVASMQPHVPFYADVALLMAVVTVVAGLLFARFLERWL